MLKQGNFDNCLTEITKILGIASVAIWRLAALISPECRILLLRLYVVFVRSSKRMPA